MACQLTNIIAAIAGISITADGITPSVYYGDTIKQGGDNAPMRVILPSDVDSDNKGTQFANVGSGTILTVTWKISDLFLLQRMTTGSGLNQVADTLVKYVAAYTDALPGKQTLLSGAKTTVGGVSFGIGVYQYPVGIDAWYYGVEVRWQVTEIVT